ncbi:unnamed protein product, partial [Rotaria sp. Silwood2]
MKEVRERLKARDSTIDSNIDSEVIEWIIDDQEKAIIDFNDPKAFLVCTGLLTRMTDKHPELLPELQWWYTSCLCSKRPCFCLGKDKSKMTIN